MMVHIDKDYLCHDVASSETKPVETSFFDNKPCKGYRFIPDGESWTREDGTVFSGEMAAPAPQ